MAAKIWCCCSPTLGGITTIFTPGRTKIVTGSFTRQRLISSGGDGPADALDLALSEINEQFQKQWQRPPTKAELLAGLNFALPEEE